MVGRRARLTRFRPSCFALRRTSRVRGPGSAVRSPLGVFEELDGMAVYRLVVSTFTHSLERPKRTRGLPTADCRLPTADRRPPTANP